MTLLPDSGGRWVCGRNAPRKGPGQEPGATLWAPLPTPCGWTCLMPALKPGTARQRGFTGASPQACGGFSPGCTRIPAQSPCSAPERKAGPPQQLQGADVVSEGNCASLLPLALHDAQAFPRDSDMWPVAKSPTSSPRSPGNQPNGWNTVHKQRKQQVFWPLLCI